MSQQPKPQATPNKVQQKADKVKSESVVGNFFKSPWTKSIALHSAILASLLVSFNFAAKPLLFVSEQLSSPQVQQRPQADTVQATFIDSQVIEQNKREKAQAEAAAKQKEKRKQEAEEKERLRKKRIEDERKKKEAEKQQEIERQNKLEEEKLKEQEIQAQREKERQEKLEQERMQKQLEQEMAEQLQKEQESMSKANQQRIMSEVEKYRALVYSKVSRNLDTDGGFIGEYCSVSVKLAPDGLVLLAKAQSGNPALCRIAEAAVLKAGTLPVSKDPEVMAQFRNFTIEVRPEK